MKARAVVVVIGVALAALAAWQAAAPLLTFNAIAEAARAGDAPRLERLVDFPAVRESLKSQLSDRLRARIAADRGLADNPFGTLGALLAPAIVDQVVEAAVTPAGVAAMVVSAKAPLGDVGPGKTALPPPPDAAAPPHGAPKPKSETRYAYAGLAAFKAEVWSQDRRSRLTWVLERRGLGWRLAGVELPPE